MRNGNEAEVVHINECLKADYHFATLNGPRSIIKRSKLIHLVWWYSNVWGFRHHRPLCGSNENDLRGMWGVEGSTINILTIRTKFFLITTACGWTLSQVKDMVNSNWRVGRCSIPKIGCGTTLSPGPTSNNFDTIIETFGDLKSVSVAGRSSGQRQSQLLLKVLLRTFWFVRKSLANE